MVGEKQEVLRLAYENWSTSITEHLGKNMPRLAFEMPLKSPTLLALAGASG